MRTTLQLPSLRLRALLGALALTIVSIGPSAAHAQSITIVVESFGGRDAPVLLSGTSARPISAAECESNAPIPLQLTNVPWSMMQRRYLSVWRGTQMSAACQTATNRRSTGTTAPPCTFVGSFPITMNIMEIELGAGDAFDDQCDMADDQEFWFLAVPSAMDDTTNVPMGEFTYGSLLIGIDPTPPEGPTGLEPSAGDRQIQIEWDNPEGSESLSGANVYVDTAGCDDSGNVIEGGALVEGDAPSGSPQVSADGSGVRSATLDGQALGLMTGDYAAVAVSIVDLANNESPLSNVVCIQRVEVLGFWDAYCTDRGLEDEECGEQYGCAAGSPRGGRGAFAGLAFVLGAILFVSRRRARRSVR